MTGWGYNERKRQKRDQIKCDQEKYACAAGTVLFAFSWDRCVPAGFLCALFCGWKPVSDTAAGIRGGVFQRGDDRKLGKG